MRVSVARGVALVAAVVVVAGAAVAGATSPPDRGMAFEPRSSSRPLYGTQPPWEDPERQRHYVAAGDGVQLFVETWLPAARDGHRPPKRLPTILVASPYPREGREWYSYEEPHLVAYFTSRGYAVAQHHIRGRNKSGGCVDQTGPLQIDDTARVIEYLGRDAPWSDGSVGMYGISYDAETQVSVAGLGDPKRTKYLKAIVPASSVGGQYEWNFADGVPWGLHPASGNLTYFAGGLRTADPLAQGHLQQRLDCTGETMSSSADVDGDYGDYWREREYRPGAPQTKAAVLYVHGLRDFGVMPSTVAGWFDRLPASTPHKGIFGVFGHAFPSDTEFEEPDWARADWMEMVAAWYDRYLKGLPTRVETWPAVQVQDNLGQWRALGEFPTTGGPAAQLALGPAGTLGATRPTGSTAYREQLHLGAALPGQQAVFETEPVTAPLHLTGQPILDLWVVLDRPDAHVAAALEVIGTDGQVMRHSGSDFFPHDPVFFPRPPMATYGARSLRHLAPMRRGWFEQEEPVAPAVGSPVHANVRFLPTDLIVPPGGRLRVTISGSVAFQMYLFDRVSHPSGSATGITVLHDCKHPSALRFLLPDPNEQLLNVREKDEESNVLTSRVTRIGRQDGAGMATATVCDRPPALVSLLRNGTER
jgi:predicted acyl esterase